MKKLILIFLTILISFPLSAQVKRVLFLGNSYTYVNNLPMLITGLAMSAGDSLYTDSHTPGGYTLGWQPIQHVTDSTSLARIRSGNWDFVVLQEQSQTPSIPVLRDSCMFPASSNLYDTVRLYNSCGHILFYLTWGRRFGGMQCFVPNYCSIDFADFSQMQDSVTRAYHLISDMLDEPVAPAGEAWRLVLNNTAMVLHDVDDSHPSLNGSYLTACVFYSSIFKKRSYGLPFTAGLMPDSALILQAAADSIVFSDPGYWNLWENDPEAQFSYSLHEDTLVTTNLSSDSQFFLWDFGDGSFSSDFEPVHIYSQSGNYNVILQSCDSCNCDTVLKSVTIGTLSTGMEKGSKVIMAGPDRSGNVRFINFNVDGILRLVDISGRDIAEIPVESGIAAISSISRGIYLWELVVRGKVLARGKCRM